MHAPRHGQPRRPRHAHRYARPEELREFYASDRWRKLSQLQLIEHPLCADPYQIHAKAGIAVPAVQSHHIIPLRVGMAHALEQSNLQSLCSECHARADAQLRRATAQGNPYGEAITHDK